MLNYYAELAAAAAQQGYQPMRPTEPEPNKGAQDSGGRTDVARSLLDEITALRAEVAVLHAEQSPSAAVLPSVSFALVALLTASISQALPTIRDVHRNDNDILTATTSVIPVPRPPIVSGESLRPINQIEPTSSLGLAFKQVARLSRKDTVSTEQVQSEPREPPSPDDSSDKEVSHNCYSRSRGLPTLKPREPTPYDGKADYHEFHKFLDEATNYVNGYHLTPDRYVKAIAPFLKHKAYKFYTMMVAKDSTAWDLERFFRSLFNFCFPVDFRTRMRVTLHEKVQGRLSVQEFVCEIEELFMMVGLVSPRDRVQKLWYGLHHYLQAEMYQFGLAPDVSSWEDVVVAATRFELAIGAERAQLPTQPPQSFGSLFACSDQSANQRRRHDRDSGCRTFSRLPVGTLSSSASRFLSARDGGRNGHGSQPVPSKVLAPVGSSLSDKERSELHATGKCFHCKESGHLARNCPKVNNVKSTRRGQPPGMGSFQVSVDFDRMDALRKRAAATNGITLHMAKFASDYMNKDSIEDMVTYLPYDEDLSSCNSPMDDLDAPLPTIVDQYTPAPPIELLATNRDSRKYVRFDPTQRMLRRS